MKKPLLFSNPLLIACLLAAVFSAAAQELPTAVKVDVVRRQAMTQTVPVIGRLVAPQSGVVAARTDGPVAGLTVEVGDHVARGEVLAKLDQARQKARVALQETELQELEARLATAEAREKLARQELGRLERLRGTAAFNESLYDNRVQELATARSTRREAEARIARGRVALDLARIELQDSRVRAPFPGVVTLRHTNEGAWLKPGDPVVTLVNDRDLEVEADVPAERLGGVAPGDRLEVQIDAGTRLQAVVRAVIPDENIAARTRPVRLIPDFATLDPATLAVNQSVILMVPVAKRSEVVSVHKDAVLRSGGGALVYVVDQGTAQPRPVQLGEAIGTRFRVLDGLVPGDVVVIRGNERLRPGERVSYPGQPEVAQHLEKQG